MVPAGAEKRPPKRSEPAAKTTDSSAPAKRCRHKAFDAKPFLKWAGGKYRIRQRIVEALPPGERLVEPFAGSAAIFLSANYPAALLCDANSDLITLYKTLQLEKQAFIQYCQSFFCASNNTLERFLVLRDQYNTTRDAVEKSALLLYLNRHAYNGLIRYNKKNRYNVPFGQYKRPRFPLVELNYFLEKMSTTETQFACCDFRTTFHCLQTGDVVYCDPPYVPLSTSASFTAYAGHTFYKKDQRELAETVRHACSCGYPVLVSNHDTEQTRQWYSGADIISFSVQRFISCHGNTRLVAPELLARFLP